MDEITPTPEIPLEPVPPRPTRNLRWIFVGGNGIRAGWGVLLFILIFIAAGLLAGVFKPPSSAVETPADGLIYEVRLLFSVLIATGVLALIERKSLLDYGYQGRARLTRLLWGLFWGFVAMSATMLALWKLGFVSFDGQLLHGAATWKYGALWGLVFLIVGFVEESTLRGYIQFTLTRGIGFWWGAIIFSMLFGFIHGINPGETPVGLFSAGAVGLVFCLSLWYTGSLWWAVGFHAAWDWGESYFYGTSDSGNLAQGHLFGEHPVGNLLWSGGKTGPEGSLLVIPLLLLTALFIWLWWRHRVQSPFADSGWRPAWSRKPRNIETATIETGPIEAAS